MKIGEVKKLKELAERGGDPGKPWNEVVAELCQIVLQLNQICLNLNKNNEKHYVEIMHLRGRRFVKRNPDDMDPTPYMDHMDPRAGLPGKYDPALK